MSWRQSDIDKLKASIASGIRTVAYADRTVTYQSVAEMLQVLAAMEGEVSQSASGRSTFASFERD